MPFSKFDPHRPEARQPRTTGERRALLLQWGWRITLAYTMLGFGLLVYWFVRGT